MKPKASAPGGESPGEIQSLFAARPAGQVIAFAGVLFALVFAARCAHDRPSMGVHLFYIIPVILLALRFGVRGGLIGAGVAIALFVGWAVVDNDDYSLMTWLSPMFTVLIVGALVGYLSQSLLETVQRYAIALNATPILLFRTDTDGRYTWTHHTWAGRIDVEMVGRTDTELLGPQGERPEALKRRAIETDEPLHEVYDLIDPQGERRWFSVTLEPLHDRSGAVSGLTGSALDISPEMRATEALERSEQRFREAAENQLEPFAVYSTIRDERGKVIDFLNEFINAPGAESVGLRPGDMIGKTLSELFPGRLEHGLMEEYIAVVETGEPLFREAADFVNVLGEEELVRAFDIRVSKLGDGIEITWRDITDKMRAERERDWLAAIVEHSGDAIMSADINGRIASWSSSAEQLYGYASEEAVGRPFTMLFDDDELPLRKERMDRLFAGERLGPIRALERRKDGSRIDITYMASPILNADGAVVGAARIVRENRRAPSDQF